MEEEGAPEAIDMMTAAVQQETSMLSESVRKYAPSSHRLRKMVEALESTSDPEAVMALQQKIEACAKLLEERAAKPFAERIGSAAYIDLEHDGAEVSSFEYDLSTDEEEADAI